MVIASLVMSGNLELALHSLQYIDMGYHFSLVVSEARSRSLVDLNPFPRKTLPEIVAGCQKQLHTLVQVYFQ
ncbi:hypothetical protein P8452_30931 [Trifolium repens]|nr:hypothetical protein P8452_30931 [Trifolium repens]